jgi:hypothetical protein
MQCNGVFTVKKKKNKGIAESKYAVLAVLRKARDIRNADAVLSVVKTARLVLCRESRDDECWGAVKPVFGFCHNVYMCVMLGRPQGASVVSLLFSYYNYATYMGRYLY